MDGGRLHGVRRDRHPGVDAGSQARHEPEARGTAGVLGVLAIKKHGGIAIAQDEATSECFDMPQSAINTGKVDLVLPLDAIASTLVNLVTIEDVA